MAITITDSQLTKVYLAAQGTAVTTALEAETAITGGKQITCLQSLGEITSSKSVQEYACLSSNEIAKSIGSLTLGNLTMDLLFNAADAVGQADLRLMYSGNERRELIIKLTDDAGTSPTYITFEVAISGQSTSIEKDSAVMMKNTIEVCSNPVLILAVA